MTVVDELPTIRSADSMDGGLADDEIYMRNGAEDIYLSVRYK